MTKFRPCIDLHEGKVKQIVGGTLSENQSELKTNFVSAQPSSYYAQLYKSDQLTGGHIIQLGAGNEEACLEAIRAYPGGLQVGGGINQDNAAHFLQAGASHVIVTSWLFDQAGVLQKNRLEQLSETIGKENLVVDLSCRKTKTGWVVAMNRWQTLTDVELCAETISYFSNYCDELLIHAADVEGLQAGMDEELLSALGAWAACPITYAGGARSLEDLYLAEKLSNGVVDVTIGSALDIFGGTGAKYQDCVAFNLKT